MIPFFLVPLMQPTWEAALSCAQGLPEEALAVLPLDRFPEADPAEMVRDLNQRCLVSTESPEAFGRLQDALEARPAWIQLPWDFEIPESWNPPLSRTRILRSQRHASEVWDLEERLQELPRGEAFLWSAPAHQLQDNVRIKPGLEYARTHALCLSAYLEGPLGRPSRCLQAAWGGSFTLASAPNNGPPPLDCFPFDNQKRDRFQRLTSNYQLCLGVGLEEAELAMSVINGRFRREFKDLIFLPLEGEPFSTLLEGFQALEVLGVLAGQAFQTTLGNALGVQEPVELLWRRSPAHPWSWRRTQASAPIPLEAKVQQLETTAVLFCRECG